jgi:hypothetical protein
MHNVVGAYLLEAFLYAAKRGLGYKDFFLAVAAVGGAPVQADHRLAEKLRELVQLASRSPPGWRIPRDAILVDGLGLAEAYFIYKWLAAAGMPPAVDVGVNPRGDTYGFKQRLGVENMIQASQKLEELTLFTSIDKAVHSLPSMPAEELASAMERAVAERLRLIAEEALRRRASIATDHAYDVVCARDGCRLCHGPRCPGTLSKLAVALLMG